MFSRRPEPRFNRGRIAVVNGGGSPAPPAGPSPTLVTPETGDTFGDGDVVIMHATIPGGAPAVSSVEFYQGATKVGEALAEPWQYLWTTAQGAYDITARALYADASVGTSAAASITVAAPLTFDPTTVAQLALWADPTDNATITLNAGRVETIARFRDATKYSTALTQATSAARPVLGRLRGRQALFSGSGTSERLTASLVGAQGFPHTLVPVIKGIGQQTAGNVCSTGGIARVSIRGTTWPRTLREQTSLVLDSTANSTVSKPLSVRFLANNTASEVSVNGVMIHGPGAASGTSGLSTDVSFPGLNSGTAEPGLYGDFLHFQGAVSGADVTAIEAWLNAKWHTLDPQATILYVGDSNTRGFGTANGGFRRNMHDDLLSRGKICGKWVEEIGSKPEGGARYFGGDVHYGVDGRGINYMRANLPALIGTTTEQFNPAVMVLMIGINNASSAAGPPAETYVAGNGAGSTRDEFRNLITDIFTKLPAVKLIVCNLPPNGTAGTQTNVVTLNATWFADADTAATALGKTVKHCDIYTALGGAPFVAANFSDLTHFGELTGHPLVAAVLKPLIIEAVSEI